MFKKIDYIIIFFCCTFLGIFIISQVYARKEVKKVIQPENNEVLAIEVSKLTRSNADLRIEVRELTDNLDNYRKTSQSAQNSYSQYLNDEMRLDLINGQVPSSGQGIVMSVHGQLVLPQMVDLLNAIRNSGGELISINDVRLMTNSNISLFLEGDRKEVKILGNSHLLKSALERKGGIIEQLSNKQMWFTIEEKDIIQIPSSKESIQLKYSKVITK